MNSESRGQLSTFEQPKVRQHSLFEATDFQEHELIIEQLLPQLEIESKQNQIHLSTLAPLINKHPQQIFEEQRFLLSWSLQNSNLNPNSQIKILCATKTGLLHNKTLLQFQLFRDSFEDAILTNQATLSLLTNMASQIYSSNPLFAKNKTLDLIKEGLIKNIYLSDLEQHDLERIDFMPQLRESRRLFEASFDEMFDFRPRQQPCNPQAVVTTSLYAKLLGLKNESKASVRQKLQMSKSQKIMVNALPVAYLKALDFVYRQGYDHLKTSTNGRFCETFEAIKLCYLSFAQKARQQLVKDRKSHLDIPSQDLALIQRKKDQIDQQIDLLMKPVALPHEES
ncbi:MAG: hypothetical protein OXF85_01235 [Candidatus Saccharibacteria bacterium]|nr:hypothetical protein [Candidatus Saccharibacteria bacterium]